MDVCGEEYQRRVIEKLQEKINSLVESLTFTEQFEVMNSGAVEVAIAAVDTIPDDFADVHASYPTLVGDITAGLNLILSEEYDWPSVLQEDFLYPTHLWISIIQRCYEFAVVTAVTNATTALDPQFSIDYPNFVADFTLVILGAIDTYFGAVWPQSTAVSTIVAQTTTDSGIGTTDRPGSIFD